MDIIGIPIYFWEDIIIFWIINKYVKQSLIQDFSYPTFLRKWPGIYFLYPNSNYYYKQHIIDIYIIDCFPIY